MLKRSDVLIFIHGNDESAGKAFRSIYEEYSKLIRFVAGKYLDVEADVDDVVIESFVALYESRKEGPGYQVLSGYHREKQSRQFAEKTKTGDFNGIGCV